MPEPAFHKGSFVIELSKIVQFISAIGAVVPECHLHITKTKARTIAVDPANVCLAIVEMCGFEVQGFKEDTETVLGLDIEAIKGLLKPVQEMEATARVSWQEGTDSDKPLLDIKIASKGYHARFETFDRHTIRKEPNPPQITLKSEFSCRGDRFLLAVNSCAIISDYCRIDIPNNRECSMAAKGENHQCRIDLAAVADKPARAAFSLDYLKDISKVLARATINMRIDNDHPLSINAEIPPGVTVKYLLAPKIMTEDSGEWL